MTAGQPPALLAGAGTSAGRPSGLPLGRAFDGLLMGCLFDAASRCAPGQVTGAGLAAVRRRRCNLLTRLAVRAGRQVVVELLDCFRVVVPTEAQLLIAALAEQGVPVLTLNINDGIERAHALLRGDVELPAEVPDGYHRALDRWRHRVPVTQPLQVAVPTGTGTGTGREQQPSVSRSGHPAPGHVPLLVRLRGSAEAGWHASLVPRADDPSPQLDATRFSDDLVAALRAVTEGRHLAVTGVSGADRDCRTSLPPLLGPGRFTWTCVEPDPEMAALLHAIDPAQPVRRSAIDGLRPLLPGSLAAGLPAWPDRDPGVPVFTTCFQRWRAALPDEPAAATYADLLAEAGHVDEAAAIRNRLTADFSLSLSVGRRALPG